MSTQRRAREPHTHSTEVGQVHERVLAGTPVRSRYVEVRAGERVHILETGTGPPVVLLHGTGGSGLFLLPLLEKLDGVRAMAPDRPGQGLSDPIDLPRDGYREAAVAWVDRLLDTLELDSATVLGHSMGGLWALWYAVAHPDRVDRLMLIGVPALPKTRCPLPFRLIATPGVGELLQQLPPSPKSVLQFARFMGEKATLADHPDLVELQVAASRDPVAAAVRTPEARVIVSPFALLSPSGFRRRTRVRPAELRHVTMPTLVVWGERDPVGSAAVARAATELIPDARLEVLPAGHAPWLGYPEQTAALVADFVHGSKELAMITQPPTHEQIRDAWDAIAPRFDEFVTPKSTQHGEQALHRLAIRPGTRFLDVAAGSGALSIPAARLGAEVVATDIAPTMIERLVARAHAEGLTNVEGKVMDGQHLDFPGDSFDMSVSQHGVSLFPDVSRGLAELVRVTRPDGKVLVVAWGALQKAEFLGFFASAIKAVVPAFTGPPMDPPPLPFQLADADVFRRTLTAAGLSDVTVDTITWDDSYDATHDAGTRCWNLVTSSNPIGEQLAADLTVEQRTEVQRVLGGMLRERAGGQPRAVLHAEVNIGIGTA